MKLPRIHAVVALIAMILLSFTYYTTDCTYSLDINAVKCLFFRFSAARLGNQMFRIVSGYSIAEQLNRKLCFNLRGYGDEANVRRTLARIAMAFPRTFLSYTMVTSDVEKALVPFAYDAEGRRVCCVFEDPLRYINHSAKFLVLDTEYGQNVRYIENCLANIRDLLIFSNDVRRAGDRIIESWKVAEASAFCIHTRRTDFELYQAATEVNETIKAALKLSKNHELTTFLLFGDDQQFLEDLATKISECRRKNVLPKNEKRLTNVLDASDDFFLLVRFSIGIDCYDTNVGVLVTAMQRFLERFRSYDDHEDCLFQEITKKNVNLLIKSFRK